MIKSFGDFGPWKNEDQLLDGILTTNSMKVEGKSNKDEDKKKPDDRNELQEVS